MSIARSRRKQIGATLAEVMITTGLFSLLMLTLFAVMEYGVRSWSSVESRSSVQTMMRKIEVFLIDDLRRSSYSQLAVSTMPSGWNTENLEPIRLNNPSGTALWFLSAVKTDETTGEVEFMRDNQGKPIWQRNVVYYVAAIPESLHNSLPNAGSCSGKEYCPHHWLIRKEVDLITDPAVPELLLSPGGAVAGCSKTAITKFIQPPTSLDVNEILKNEAGIGVKKVQVLADCLIAFKVTLQIPQVTVVMKAFRLEEARKANRALYVGDQSLESNPYTIQYNCSIVPNN